MEVLKEGRKEEEDLDILKKGRKIVRFLRKKEDLEVQKVGLEANLGDHLSLFFEILTLVPLFIDSSKDM